MNRFLKDNRGFISIYMIMWMAVLIPILLFTFIDLTHYIYESKHLKSVTDNATASAVTQIKEELVPSGVLEIDEKNAEAVALKVLKQDLLLNDDLTPKENSILKEKPMIQMHVLNITSKDGYDFETPMGVVKIFKPSVVIYAEYPVSGLFYYRSGLLLKKVSVSQVQFKNNSMDGENNGSGGNEGGNGNEGNNGSEGNNGGNESNPTDKTFTVTTPESLESTKEYTYVIPGLKSVKDVTSNTGKVKLAGVEGDRATVKVSDGEVTRTVQTGGSYNPAESKYVDGQTSPNYNVGGFSGTLEQYVYSGSYLPADSKYVDGQNNAYYNQNGYTGYLQPYIAGYEEKLVQRYADYFISSGSCPELYPGGSYHFSYYTEDVMGAKTCYYGYTVTENVSITKYQGTVSRPASDTRVYRYRGTVTKPESDTRTYDNYYQYELSFKYIY